MIFWGNKRLFRGNEILRGNKMIFPGNEITISDKQKMLYHFFGLVVISIYNLGVDSNNVEVNWKWSTPDFDQEKCDVKIIILDCFWRTANTIIYCFCGRSVYLIFAHSSLSNFTQHMVHLSNEFPSF